MNDKTGLSKLVPDELPELGPMWPLVWSLKTVNAARAAYGFPDLAAHEFYQEAPAPREELATEQQREDMRELQIGMPGFWKVSHYWTEEEIADPRLTYREAEKAIKHLRYWPSHQFFGGRQYNQVPLRLKREIEAAANQKYISYLPL
jgi:hypothetical protein